MTAIAALCAGERGADGNLRDTALALVEHRSVIVAYCDYHNDERTLSAAFVLPEPLPQEAGSFLLDLHAWLEGRQPQQPRLAESCPLQIVTVH